jgi:hypothetical protein
MRTRGQLAAVAALALVSAAGCQPLLLDLSVGDAAPGDGVPDPIPCTQASACAGTPTPLCDRDAGVCVQCLASTDCPRKTNIPHCVKNACIACMTAADCNDGGVGPRLCNTAIPRCTESCGGDAADECLTMDSSGNPIPEACAGQTLPICVECPMVGVSSWCASRAAGAYCYGLPSGACGCQTDADCPDGGLCQAPSGPSRLRFCAGSQPLM